MRSSWSLVLVVAACGGSTVTPDAMPAQAVVADLPLQATPKLDLLFVIDDSPSMRFQQMAIAATVPGALDELAQGAGGLPDLHVGVVSSDLGAGDYGIMRCHAPGDAGHLLQGSPIARCAQLDAAATFLADAPDGAGGRTRNYTGSLADAVACMTSIGGDGCDYEQHLESMRTALDPATTFNAGFVRDDAYLGVVIVGDEDDCSMSDPSLFDPVRTDAIPLSNLRCTAYGVVCTGDEDPAHFLTFGARAGCGPREDSAFVFPVQRYASFLAGLKADPAKVLVAELGGAATPFAIGPDTFDNQPDVPALQPACGTQNGLVMPAVRRRALVDAFADRGRAASMCDGGLGEAIATIASRVGAVAGNPCVPDAVADTDATTPGVQPSCTAVEVTGQGETAIPACAAGAHATPCFEIVADAIQCAATPSHVRVAVDHGASAPPTGAHLRLTCAVP